jgi:hypothetical protein
MKNRKEDRFRGQLKENKSKKEEEKNETSYKNLFDFFDLVVNFFSQVCRV